MKVGDLIQLYARNECNQHNRYHKQFAIITKINKSDDTYNFYFINKKLQVVQVPTRTISADLIDSDPSWKVIVYE